MASEHISLYTLNQQIKDQLDASFPGTVWLIAEISEIRTTRAGHCYLELIEKSTDSDEIIAKARGTIWSFTFRMLKPYFETTTGQALQPGLKVLLKASVQFQEVYGYSLNIKDIDPNFTLGDIEQKKRATIKQLEEDGVIDMNKETWLNPVPQRIAIISSPTAAGYQDFVHQLENNPDGFKIYHHLFPAIVQGDEAESSIIRALDKIYEHENKFDAVALIRGGGSSADLMCFDSYSLALNIAQFPLPVLTGIGHERDSSVADMVAHTSLKTPTAVAEFIIQGIKEFFLSLEGLQTAFRDISMRNLKDRQHALAFLAQKIPPIILRKLNDKKKRFSNLLTNYRIATGHFIDLQQRYLVHQLSISKYLTLKRVTSERQDLTFFSSKLQLETKGYFKARKQDLQLFRKACELSDPVQLLNKGYSITLKNNKLIKSISDLAVGDELTTRLKNGTVKSIIETLK